MDLLYKFFFVCSQNPSTPLPATAGSSIPVSQPRVIAVNTIAVATPVQAASTPTTQPVAATATIVTPATAGAQTSTPAIVSPAVAAASQSAAQPAPAKERRQLSLTVCTIFQMVFYLYLF